MNVFYNGEIKARKIVEIKNSFMVGQEPNGNYMLTFEDGSQQEISWEFMNKWSVPKPSLLAGSGLKEGQIIADVDSDNEKVETNLVLGYFLEFEDGRNSYVCQKVFDEWYLNVPDYNGEQLEEDEFFDDTEFRHEHTSNEIYQEVINTQMKVVEAQLGILNHIQNVNVGVKETHSNLSLWLEKIEQKLDTQILYTKGQTIMEVVLFVLLLISLFN